MQTKPQLIKHVAYGNPSQLTQTEKYVQEMRNGKSDTEMVEVLRWGTACCNSSI